MIARLEPNRSGQVRIFLSLLDCDLRSQRRAASVDFVNAIVSLSDGNPEAQAFSSKVASKRAMVP
jgi:hypothetical protein